MKLVVISLLILLSLLQGKLWLGNDSIIQVIMLRKQVYLQQEKVKKLKERNRLLEAEVQDLKYRLGALEERARSDLGMVRQGEIFYQYAAPE